MIMSIVLPQRPAFCLYHNFSLVVSTYQLDSPDHRSGSLYFLSPDLQVVRSEDTPAGVFRFYSLEPSRFVAALTDGSLYFTSSDGSAPVQIPVSSEMLLDVSVEGGKAFTTSNNGQLYEVDVTTQKVVSSVDAHKYSYCEDPCEVWTCSSRGSLVCTGGEDAVLRLWDSRDSSITSVGTYKLFEAGVTYTEYIGENVILTGSYDEKIRQIDIRNMKSSLLETQTNGGVWHMQKMSDHKRIVSCMYGGWCIIDDQLNILQKDVDSGKQLLYGIASDGENVFYTTFNDYSVHKSTISI